MSKTQQAGQSGQDIEMILKSLIPAIENIDGGCSSCIEKFVEEANRGLIEQNAPYIFKYSSWLDGNEDNLIELIKN